MRAGRSSRVGAERAALTRAAPLWVAIAVLGACDGPAGTIEDPPLPPERDAASLDASMVPEGGTPCGDASDCDDGVECTRDLCVKGGYCVNSTDATRCDDGVFCNGYEVCEPLTGCRAGSPQRCNDDDVCTIDYCDESRKACAHDARDFDDDGEVDWHCLGGTDCNDFDGTQARAAAEICADSVDNDCDDTVDEDDCGQVAHDTCEDALDISAGGLFQIELGGASPDYRLGCAASTVTAGRDVAYTFTTEKTHDVTLIATGFQPDGTEETATLALRRECSDFESELDCSRGFPSTQMRIRALPAGRYYVIASALQSSKIVIEARFDDATDPPPNVTCEGPIEIGGGGHFEGSFADVGDDTSIPCNGFPSADLFYQLTLEQEQDVELSALSLTGERMHMAVRSACDDGEGTLRCISAAPARGRLHQLPAGTYYVVLEGPSSNEVDFNLDVAILPPSAPPPGDSCANPLDLEIGTDVTGSLVNFQDLVTTNECGCKEGDSERGCGSYLPDVVYRVELAEPTDLRLRINGGPASVAYHVRTTCGDIASEPDCGAGTMTDTRLRNLDAGTHYLVLESADTATYSVRLDPLPATVPVMVAGNDTCATAYEVPEEGGLFAGDTSVLSDHYQATTCDGEGTQLSGDAVFRLLLRGRSHVIAALQGSFDTVLYAYQDLGLGPASCAGDDLACDDDGGLRNRSSLLDRTLDAGVYYFVVDGFNKNNEGAYLFDVSVSLP